MSTPSSATQRSQAPAAVTRDEETEQLIKSRKRVKDHGEVFTPRHMVNRMLDLVQEDLETGPEFVDKTFLEPSAGDGNFLIAILSRKLRAIENRFQPETWPTEALFALASIYGIEILEDNIAAAKSGLLSTFITFHESHGIDCGPRTDLGQSAAFLIDANVIHGNTLTGVDASGHEIEFSWWYRVLNNPRMVRREPFTFLSLRRAVTGAFDFAVYETYEQCRIDQVHKGVRADV